jgi:hypothetical protein
MSSLGDCQTELVRPSYLFSSHAVLVRGLGDPFPIYVLQRLFEFCTASSSQFQQGIVYAHAQSEAAASRTSSTWK